MITATHCDMITLLLRQQSNAILQLTIAIFDQSNSRERALCFIMPVKLLSSTDRVIKCTFPRKITHARFH
uniref:Bm1627 n=1 Tax=Brugia malayi TaxID=6279 RepID=A0A1I9G5U8_BRUMA|nr:Bm1627 [Brugia malayi]